MSARLVGVSIVEGQSAMTEMFSPLSSSASATVKAATAAFDAVYAVMLAPCRGLSAGRAEMLTMCPPRPALRKLATAARQLIAQDRKFIESCCSKTFIGLSEIGAQAKPPAMFTTAWIGGSLA